MTLCVQLNSRPSHETGSAGTSTWPELSPDHPLTSHSPLNGYHMMLCYSSCWPCHERLCVKLLIIPTALLHECHLISTFTLKATLLRQSHCNNLRSWCLQSYEMTSSPTVIVITKRCFLKYTALANAKKEDKKSPCHILYAFIVKVAPLRTILMLWFHPC